MEKISTKHTEDRYMTSDPALMYNRYFADNVYRVYNESFCDEDSGEVVTIERREFLFERGAHIDGDAIAKLRFYLSSGDIKEVAVSSQRRCGVYSTFGSCTPYIAKVLVGGKKYKVLLYASSLQNVLDIVADFGELNFEGRFNITTAKELDYAEIYLDTLQPIDLTEEYLKDKISMTEWAAAEKAAKPDNNASQHFWRLDLYIQEIYEDAQQGFNRSYIIRTSSVERALALVEVLLYKEQEERASEFEKSGKEMDKASYVTKINSVAPMKIDYVIPTDFSAAYNKSETK